MLSAFLVAILKMKLKFTRKPKIQRKRVFASSPRALIVADTAEERNALMQYVYPKLSEYCRQEHGLEFQVNLMSRDQLVTSHLLLAVMVDIQ